MHGIQTEASPGRDDDRVLQLTRWVALLIIPFLVAATFILLTTTNETDPRFAWPVSPAATAVLMGSGYLGGAYFFSRVLMTERWRTIRAGYLPVVTYTLFMLSATIVHLDRFVTTRLAFWAWIILYILAPILLLWNWRLNRNEILERDLEGETVPFLLRFGMLFLGIVVLAISLISFVFPNLVMTRWPWELTELTGRVVVGWHALLGAGAIALGFEKKWEAWRIPLQSIGIWLFFLLAGLIYYRAEVQQTNWYFWVVTVGLLGLVAIYTAMEWQHRGKKPEP